MFPMEEAKVEKRYKSEMFKDVDAGILKWPLSVIRLSSKNRDELLKASSMILREWRNYSDPSIDVIAYSTVSGSEIPHNTITPIARKNGDGVYEMDLVLRNNRTTDEYPYGIFHPHEELHHVKKENIGLIEVMGLAVLPGRLKNELDDIEMILSGDRKYDKKEISADDPLFKHVPWIDELVNKYGMNLKREEAEVVVKDEVGKIFLKVLMDAGVFKRDEKGKAAFDKFLDSIHFKKI